ncbi:oxygenase MpaB family protein [Salinibacterium hongtaonis]|nr:oxygenase MpaB family protein [Salinibacterium hongtaonis]
MTRSDQNSAKSGLHDGIALTAGSANVIMQLAMLPVGHGVARSTVESGRIDRHPVKRTRTTLTYLAIASAGTEQERAELRRQINRVHAQVHSSENDPVSYNAFDRDLQMWVAACLYWGAEDVYRRMNHQREPDDEFYRRGAALGTTLQVPAEMWPAHRAEFERYWRTQLASIRMDDLTREYLHGIARMTFLPTPLRQIAGPLNRFLTLGYLPQEVRNELGMPWSDASQRRFDRWVDAMAAVNRRTPALIRKFPFNWILADARRRMRRGIPLV